MAIIQSPIEIKWRRVLIGIMVIPISRLLVNMSFIIQFKIDFSTKSKSIHPMKTQTRNLRGLIKPNAKITCLHDYPPAVWMAMAEDFDARNQGEEIFPAISGICFYLKRALKVNGFTEDNAGGLSYTLVTSEANTCIPFYDNDNPTLNENDTRVLFCLMMYWATKGKNK